MKDPLVSIIVPAYGSENYIGETIESVLNQDYTNFELIIINDGSPDDLESVVKEYQVNDDRISYKKQENQGMCATRNNAVKLAKGEFYAFLDNDDLWHTDNLSRKVWYLQEHPKVGLVHSDTSIIDGESLPSGKELSGKSGMILDDLLSWNGTCIPAPSSILVRRKVHEDVGGFDPNLSIAGDKDYFIRVARKYEIGRIPEVTWNYRVHGSNFHKRIDVMEKDELYVLAKNTASGFYRNSRFRKRCYSNTFMILGKSFWKDAGKPLKGISMILKALLFYPPNITKLI